MPNSTYFITHMHTPLPVESNRIFEVGGGRCLTMELSLFPEDGSPELFSRSSVRQNNWSCSVIQTNKLLGHFTEKPGVGAKFDSQNRHYQSYCANRVEIYTYVASCCCVHSDPSDKSTQNTKSLERLLEKEVRTSLSRSLSKLCLLDKSENDG